MAFMQPGAVDHLLDNIDCVHHTASPFHFSARDPLEIISPAVDGTVGVLQSVKKHGYVFFFLSFQYHT